MPYIYKKTLFFRNLNLPFICISKNQECVHCKYIGTSRSVLLAKHSGNKYPFVMVFYKLLYSTKFRSHAL